MVPGIAILERDEGACASRRGMHACAHPPALIEGELGARKAGGGRLAGTRQADRQGRESLQRREARKTEARW